MSLVYILILLAVLWIIIEILSLVLKITGLSLQKARFQVISMITHTGFTTRESELITQHPQRRRIASILMVLSYIAQATLISLLFNILIQDSKQLLSIGFLLAAIIVFIIIITRNKFISSKVDRMIERFITKRIMKKSLTKPIDEVLKVSPGYGVYEIVVDSDSKICNTTLNDAKLNDMFIHVLKIDRGSSTVDFPKANFKIAEGDVLIAYGELESIKNLIIPMNN